MSIRDAIMNATRETLSSYLAADLVEQLTEEIVHRTAADIESALTSFAGFDIGRATAPRARAASAGKKSSARRGRREDSEHASSSSEHDHGHNGHNGQPPAAEPTPEQMV